MVNLAKELLNFSYREVRMNLKDIFPKIDMHAVREDARRFRQQDQHETIMNVVRWLWNGGYAQTLEKYGFYDQQYGTFSGHCHQCTPVLGAMLKAIGDFSDLAYLECFRIREHFPQTGMLDPVPPEEEPNDANREEFCSIGRIPYCCLEVKIGRDFYYISGKHMKPRDERMVALLTPQCYREFVGVLPHQNDPAKSGVYLKQVFPKHHRFGGDFTRQIVWMKQALDENGKVKDPAPEYFATFLRMTL